jgi:DNA mismatch endonuclease (patch repair protein)
MVDHLDPVARSRNMSRIRSINTKAELIVRQAAHALGYRFRLYRKELPGRPDLVFPSRGVVLFVNGCFWHRHALCRRASTPKSRTDFWENKFRRTVERDERAAEALKALGWRVSVIWECQTLRRREVERLLRRNVGRYPAQCRKVRGENRSSSARTPKRDLPNSRRNKGQ